LKYIIQIDIPATEAPETQPESLQEVIGKWQALNPIGFYASLTRRRATIIVDAPNEDSFFEAMYATWIAFKTYPEVWPVVSMDELPVLMQRTGMAP